MFLRTCIAVVFSVGLLSNSLLESARSSDWISPGGGDWAQSANWSDGVPNGIGASATFVPAMPIQSANITVSTTVTLGSLQVDNGRVETIGGAGSIVFDVAAPDAIPLIQMGPNESGRIDFDLPVAIADPGLHFNLPTESHRVYFRQGFVPNSAQLTLDGRGSITFFADNTNWTGSLILDSGYADFYAPASADVTLDGGLLSIRTGAIPYLGDVILKRGALAPNFTGSLQGALVAEAGNVAYYESGRDFQLLGGSRGSGDLDIRGSSNLTIGGLGLGHDGKLLIKASQVMVAAPLHHGGGTELMWDDSRVTVDVLGSLVGTGLTTVNAKSTLSVAEPAGLDPALHSAAPQSVKLLGGSLTVRANVSPAPFLHPDSTGGLLLINNVANYTAGGEVLDLTQLPGGANMRLSADNWSSLGAGLQIVPANSTYRFGGGRGTLDVITSLGDVNGQPNALTQEMDIDTRLFGTRLLGANTYSGLTTVTGGVLLVDHAQALGSTSAGTVIMGNKAYVEVSAPVAEPFEIRGGRLTLKTGSEGITSPVTMQGGILEFDRPGTFATAVTLRLPARIKNEVGGSPDVTQNPPTFAGGTTGEGELNLSNVVVAGAPLAHAGKTSFGNVTLETANTFTGEVIVSGGVSVRHPYALGSSSNPVRVQGGELLFEASAANAISVEGGTVEMRTSVPYAGTITMRPGNGRTADLAGSGHFGDIVIANEPSGSTVLRSGQFDGTISGTNGSRRFYVTGGSLNGANTLTNLVRIPDGAVDVNHASGLGSAEVGTIVERGTLNLNAPVAEPILISSFGTVNVNDQIARLPLSAPGSAGTIRVNAPGVYDEAIELHDSRLEINAPTTIGGVHIRGANAGLVVAPGQTLQLGEAGLEWHSGTLSGHFAGSGALHKLGTPTSRLTGEFSYDGEIAVDRGQLEVATTGTTTTTLSVPSPYSSLWMVEGRTYDGDIYLHGAGDNVEFGKDLYVTDDQRDQGPLVLNGVLNVAGRAAISGRRMVVNGPVQGESLTSYGELELQHANNSYSGATEIRDGSVLVRRDGRILNSSEIVVHRDAGFAVYNEEATEPNDRIDDSIPITMKGGSLGMRTPSGVHMTEAFGELRFAAGASSVGADYINSGNPATMHFASLSREAGATAAFHVRDNFWMTVGDSPSLTNEMIGAWAIAVDQSNWRRFATYVVDGIQPLNTYAPNIQTAGASDNVLINQNATLAADKTVNSVTGEFGELDLAGHRLTVASGGLLNLTAHNGQLTTGDAANAELILTGVATNASIVDNPAGAVNLVTAHGARLSGVNTYSGSTTHNSGDLWVLSPNALPQGTELILNGGDMYFGLNAPATFAVDRLVLRENATVHYNGYVSLQPAEAILEEGKLANIELIGNGSVVKRGPGVAEVGSVDRNSTFHGTVVVEEGTLAAWPRTFGSAAITISGGIFVAPTTDNYPFANPITLNGGALVTTGTGPVHVMKASVLLGGSVKGALTGPGDLAIESSVELRGDNHDYHGNITINGGALRVGQNSSLGTGDVTIGPSGRLELESAETVNDLYVRGGELYSRAIPAAVTGLVTIDERAFLGAEFSHFDLALNGGLRFLEDAQATKLGEARLSINGPTTVNGRNTIFAPQGVLEINGTVIPESEDAILDIVTGNFDDAPLNMSLAVPTGTSIGVYKFGAPAVVHTAGPGRFLTGNGTILNEIAIRDAGELRPGASVGALTVALNAEWGGGGVYEWEIDDALGAAGGAHGWDVLHMLGELGVTATNANPFVVEVHALDVSGGAGIPANFDPFAEYSWVMADAASVSGFSSNTLRVRDAQFRALWGAMPLGDFELVQEGEDILMTYVPASSIPGDAWPFDGRVDVNDLNAVRNHFGESGEFGIPGDLYPFDGRVDLQDLNLVRNNFGAQAASQSVPEPSMLVLGFVSALAVCTTMLVQCRNASVSISSLFSIPGHIKAPSTAGK